MSHWEIRKRILQNAYQQATEQYCGYLSVIFHCWTSVIVSVHKHPVGHDVLGNILPLVSLNLS